MNTTRHLWSSQMVEHESAILTVSQLGGSTRLLQSEEDQGHVEQRPTHTR